MGADQIAAIRPAIVEVWDGADEGKDWCATFTVSGEPDRWIQVTAASVNVAYPHQEEPARRLDAFRSEITHLHLTEWVPGRYATFYVDENLSAGRLADLIDLLFMTVHDCGPDYTVDVEYQLLRKT